MDARFRGHDKALLGVVTPAKAGVHVLHAQLKDFDGTLFSHAESANLVISLVTLMRPQAVQASA